MQPAILHPEKNYNKFEKYALVSALKPFAKTCRATNGLNSHIIHWLHVYWCYLESHFHSPWYITEGKITCLEILLRILH